VNRRDLLRGLLATTVLLSPLARRCDSLSVSEDALNEVTINGVTYAYEVSTPPPATVQLHSEEDGRLVAVFSGADIGARDLLIGKLTRALPFPVRISPA
jgi:hypothetical protein